MENNDFAKFYGIYRSNTDGKGSAFKLIYDKRDRLLFLSAAKQKADRYEWENKIMIKLGVEDIGMVLYALEEIPIENNLGKTRGNVRELVNIFHDPGYRDGNLGQVYSILKVFYDRRKKAFGLTLIKGGEIIDCNQVSIWLLPEERKVLIKLLEFALPRMLNWE